MLCWLFLISFQLSPNLSINSTRWRARSAVLATVLHSINRDQDFQEPAFEPAFRLSFCAKHSKLYMYSDSKDTRNRLSYQFLSVTRMLRRVCSLKTKYYFNLGSSRISGDLFLSPCNTQRSTRRRIAKQAGYLSFSCVSLSFLRWRCPLEFYPGLSIALQWRKPTKDCDSRCTLWVSS